MQLIKHKAKNLFKFYYDQPWRVYHNWEHIEQGLDTLSHFNLDSSYSSLVKLVAWHMHDIVYVPGHSMNEYASSNLVKYYSKDFNLDPLGVRVVEQTILATKDHELDLKDFGPGAELFEDVASTIIDVDLAGFALNSEENSKRIYKEFKNTLGVDNDNFDTEYVEGRTQFLKNMLDKESIYKTDLGKNIWEEKARSNIQDEIYYLSNHGPLK